MTDEIIWHAHTREDRERMFEDYHRYNEIHCGYWKTPVEGTWFRDWVVVMLDGSVVTVDGRGPIGNEAVTGGPYASVEEAKAVAVASHRLTS